MGVLGQGIGLIGSFIGADKARRTANRQARAVERASRLRSQQLRELAAPYLEQSKFALPGLRNFIMSQYAPQVGKDNPFLAAQHNMNLANIGQQRARGLAESARSWGATGNIGRSRGEALRIGQSAVDAANRENVGYGMQRQNWRDQAASRYMDSLMTLANLGGQGMQPMTSAIDSQAEGSMSAAGLRGAGDQGYWNSIGGMVGDVRDGKYDRLWDALMKKKPKNSLTDELI